MTLGVYYSFDIPAVLFDEFKDIAGGSTTQYELLYTFYALPNIVTPFLAGAFLADGALGAHGCATVACLVVVSGSVFVAFGVLWASFGLVLVGRLLLGAGGETIFGQQQTLCMQWFSADFQPVAMGTAITLGSLGELLNFLSTESLEHEIGLQSTLWVAVGICAASGAAALFLWLWAHNRGIGVAGTTGQSIGHINDSDANLVPDGTSTENLEGNWTPFLKLRPVILLIVTWGSTATYYIFPSITYALVDELWPGGPTIFVRPSILLVLYYLIPMVSSPVFGKIVAPSSDGDVSNTEQCSENHARRLLLVLGSGTFGIMLGFLALAGMRAPPVVGILIASLGMAAVTSSLTPLLGLSVPRHLQATAFGLWASSQNAGTVVISLIIGRLADIYSTAAAVAFLGFLAGFATLQVFILFLVEKRAGHHNLAR